MNKTARTVAIQRGRLLSQIRNQEKWIAECEANGRSYTDGERGELIRRADWAELRRLSNLLMDAITT